MNDLDTMARELLTVELDKQGQRDSAADVYANRLDDVTRAAVSAIRSALLTAPPCWKLVPTGGATDAMRAAWDAAPDNEDDDIAFHGAYRAMLAAAPEVK